MITNFALYEKWEDVQEIPIVKQLGIIDYYKRLVELSYIDKYDKINDNRKIYQKRINNLSDREFNFGF